MATQKSKSQTLKFFLVALVAAAILSYLFGWTANKFFLHDGLRCGEIGDIGGCDNTFVYLFGFYFALLFNLGILQFALQKWSNAYFYILIVPLIAIGFTDFELWRLSIGFTLAGIILGIIIRKVRSMRQLRAA